MRVLLALLAAGCILAQEQKSDEEQRGGKLFDFRYYAEVTGIYDSGLSSDGLEAGYGVIASRRGKRDKLSLEYKGAFREYSNHSIVQGLDQFLNLTYDRQLSRRLILDMKTTAGSVSLANGAFAYLPLASTELFAIPSNELFDIRTKFAQSRVDLTWRATSRLSFGIGGEGFVVRRSSLLLAGLDGYEAHANAAYRLTRHQTVSANFSHTYYDFQRAFGHSKLQSTALGYSVALSRKWDFNLFAGGIRIDSLGIEQVAIDPAIAAIVGESFANVTYARVVYAPLGEARLTRHYNQSALTLDYSVGASPGNGVYLTSKQSTGSVGYTYTGYRRWTLALNSGYTELSSVGQTLGKYTNLQGGTGIAYKVANDTHLQFRYDYRHYTTQNDIYQKDSNRVSLGLAFSPGDAPLAIW